MKITAPHLGNLHIVLADLFKRLGAEYIPPPPTSERTLTLGVKYSPEFACLPLKSTTGNFIEALEQGADTLVMVGGVGPCRFGYYAEIQKRILEEAGYDFEFITLEPPGADFGQFVGTFKRIGPGLSYWQIYKTIKICFEKGRVFDMLEKRSFQVRPYEIERGATTKAHHRAEKIVARAFTPEEIEEAKEEGLAILDSVPQDRDRNPVKIGIAGEFYLLLEPFFKFDIELWLGERGVFVDRGIYLTDWIGPSSKNPMAGVSAQELREAAKPYLSHFVGGDGLATIGHTVVYAEEGFDGVIQLLPFTCMPDTIAKAILPRVIEDHDIPVLSLIIDEQTGKAGVTTRLEAFLDLVKSRKQRKETKAAKATKVTEVTKAG
jgi:predicted nucleotide-binding protein (sugar kinase/HSP70/actin superfamily)